MEKDIKIDMVYTWVDGSDENWLKKKNQFLENKAVSSGDSAGAHRFISNDELKYSLRSVEKNLPWINHIYIITDNQKPSWLNLENEKITIIDHKDIFDEKDLPNFNSIAIESKIVNIKGLSEYFLLSNDDFFVFRPLEKSFFYNEKNLPIFRIKSKMKKKLSKSQYGFNIKYTFEKVNSKYKNVPPYINDHNIDSYCKSDVISCIEEFRSDVEKLSKEKFRAYGSFDRVGWAFWALANNRGELKKVKKVSFIDYILKFLKLNKPIESMYFGIHKKNIEKKLYDFNPGLFCINDNLKANESDRKRVKDILQKLYPDKSSFEI